MDCANDEDDYMIREFSIARKLKKEPAIQLTLDGVFIKEWENPAKAGEALGINYKNIHAVCKGQRNHAGGFKWMYLSDYEKLYQSAC